MRIVIALGGNALLRRGQTLSATNQRDNVRIAAEALAPLARDHQVIITHGNGPQVGLLALQSAAGTVAEAYPLDILDAETEGMIGYLIEQELSNRLSPERPCAALLTQIEVDPNDPAFRAPSKPIGPLYGEAEARELAEKRGWAIAPDGTGFRRVVPSPRPQRILELAVIELLVEQGVTVICAGGGGIPVVRKTDEGLVGVEAVIDKDLASALLATELKADALLMLTDVDGVYENFGTPAARLIPSTSPEDLRQRSFASGSMGPKVEAACLFVQKSGKIAAVGALTAAQGLLEGRKGTTVAP